MKIFSLNEFDEKGLNKFIDFSNEYWEQPWNIHINSGGGRIDIKDEIQFICESKMQLHNNILFSVTRADSAAFFLILESDIPIVLLPSARCMAHQYRWSIEIQSNDGLANSKDSNIEEIIKKEQRDSLKKYELTLSLMNEKEKELFNLGKDVYFDFNRLTKIFKQKEKWQKNN